jgi:hypothetical protein
MGSGLGSSWSEILGKSPLAVAKTIQDSFNVSTFMAAKEHQFAQLIRGSKPLTLFKSGAKVAGKDVPVDQAIKTTSAAFYRRNYGLKGPVPERQQSVILNVESLDTRIGIADLNTQTGWTRRIEKFREMGVPLRLPTAKDADNYFRVDSKPQWSLNDISESKIRELSQKVGDKRGDFYKFIKNKNGARAQRVTDMGNSVDEFLGMSPATSTANSGVRPTAIGVNYSLPGTLHNTPRGFLRNKIVPGRVLDNSRSSRRGGFLAAVGGFVARSTDKVRDDHGAAPMANVHDFVVNSADAGQNGRVSLTVASKSSSSGSSSFPL